jgi:hypothetical protein
VYMSASQFEYWKHTHLTIDIVDGRGAGFSVEGPTGKRRGARSVRPRSTGRQLDPPPVEPLAFGSRVPPGPSIRRRAQTSEPDRVAPAALGHPVTTGTGAGGGVLVRPPSGG